MSYSLIGLLLLFAGQVVNPGGGSSGGGGSAVVKYASQVTGSHPGVAVVPGSSAAGTADSFAVLNALTSAGNIDLEVDSGFALSSTLLLGNNTTIHCTSSQYGFIMQTASNSAVLANGTPQAPTTASGTGGFVVSNQANKNIKVIGCTLNANSTQAVTGTDISGVAHKVNPGTGLWVTGVQFVGVDNLIFDHNEIYDTGTFATLFSNDSNVHVTNNWLHQPTPLVGFKNTDGVHFIGPDKLIWAQNNRLNGADDQLALNADDSNRTGSGDSIGPYMQWTGVKWGPIVDAEFNDNIFDNSYFGLRLLSATELIDRVNITNTTGAVCAETALISSIYAPLGTGNMGAVRIAGWNVPTDGTCNIYSLPYNFWIQSNIKSLQLSGIQITNAGANWPVVTQAAGTVGNLSLRDWDIYTTTSGPLNPVVLNGGSISQIAASGMNWNDNPTNTGAFFSGSVVPTTLTCSNYAGPNRLLGSGFAPANQMGDCFTATPVATVYVDTLFNEASAGVNLAGTTPSVCSNGCVGPWTLASGTDWTYQSGGGVASSTANASVPDLINIGHTDAVIRYNMSACSGTTLANCQLVLRWVDANNYIAINMLVAGSGAPALHIYDVVGGVVTAIGSAVSGTLTGGYTVTLSGSSISATNANGTASGTTGNTTGTKMGIIIDNNGNMKLTALSAKSS